MHAVTHAALALLGLSIAGCSSSSAASGPPATFTQIYAEIFQLGTKGQCNYCHDRPPSDVSNGKLQMGHTQTDAYAALVGPSSTSAKCSGRNQIVAGDPSMSLFYLKLGASPPCGDRMPQGGSPLTDVQLEMVRSWIANGAKND